MAFKFEKEHIKLGDYDRRKKLTDDQKEEIKKLYETGMFSWRELANQFGVSKRCIGLIVNPETKRKNDEYIKEHWKTYQQSKEEHRKAIQKTRLYKKQLYENNLLQS